MEQTKKCPYCGEEILAIAKKCKHCGEWQDVEEHETEKKMVNCPVCGELIEEGINLCPYCKENINSVKPNVEVTSVAEEEEPRGFFDYYFIEPFFRHYIKFRGRLNKKHYWIAMLIWFLVLMALGIILILQTIKGSITAISLTMVLILLWCIVTLIPLYATATRRLRDADSEPSTLAWLLLVTGSPFLMFWTCKQSEDEDIRTDGLEPDKPQTVKFKKSDIITTIILSLLFLIGILGGSWGNEQSNSEETRSIPSAFIGEWDMTDNDESYIQKTIEIKEDNTFEETWAIYDNDGELIAELKIQGRCRLLPVKNKNGEVENALCRIYDLESISDPDNVFEDNDKDYFKEENENFEEAIKNGKVYGLQGIYKDGNTLRFEGGQWTEIQKKLGDGSE